MSKIRIIGDLDLYLKLLDININDIVNVEEFDRTTGAAHFKKNIGNLTINCVVFPENYEILENKKKYNNIENLKNVKITRATEAAPSEAYANTIIRKIKEKYKIEKSGYYSKYKSECECGECECVMFVIYNGGYLSVNFCRGCGVYGAKLESYINVNC